MRKFLSLMLTLALIITTLAMPISVSALNTKQPQAADGTINISYSVTALDGSDELTTFHPGDSFKVTVKATSTVQATAESYMLDVACASGLTVEKLEDDSTLTLISKDNSQYIQKTCEESTSFTADTPVELFSFKATVNDTATGNLTFDLLSTNDNIFYKDYSEDGYVMWATSETFSDSPNLTSTAKTISVTANTFEVKVGEQKMENNKTLYGVTEGTAITVIGTHITDATIKVGNGDADEMTATTEGSSYTYTVSSLESDTTYTVTVKTVGSESASISFTLSPTSVSAELKLDTTGLKADGYKRSTDDENETFEIPVKITGLGTATAAMVSFKVETPAGLTLVTDENGSIYNSDSEAFVYGNQDSDTGLSNNAEVTTIKFTIESNADYGVKEIKLTDAKLALIKDIDPTADTVSCENAKASVVVIPDGDFVTVTFGTSWVNTAYDANVTKDSAVDAKYMTSDSPITEANKDTFNGEGWTSITENNKININSTNTYYVIARVGDDSNAVYKLYSYDVQTTKFDNITPTVGVSELSGTSDWKNGSTYTLDISKLSVNEDLSGVASKQYQLFTKGDNDDYIEFTTAQTIESTTSSISFADINSFNGVIRFKATDTAGNTSEWSDGITLMIDNDNPTVSDLSAASEKDLNGKITLTAMVTDASSGVKEVKVYVDEVDSENKTSVSDVETLSDNDTATAGEDGKYTYAASKSGKYYFVAEDNVGHKSTTVNVLNVKFDTLTKAAEISVKVNPDGKYYKNVFFDTTDTNQDTYGTNGYYMYVAITAESLGDNYETTMKYYTGTSTPENAEGTTYTAGEPLTEAGDYTFVVTSAVKNSSYADDTKTATYKFSIVDEKSKMISPSGDGSYNLLDVMMIRRVLKKGTTNLPESTDWFATLYAGDVDGNFVYDSNDVSDIFSNLRKGNFKGEYDFGIMNKTATSTSEDNVESE